MRRIISSFCTSKFVFHFWFEFNRMDWGEVEEKMLMRCSYDVIAESEKALEKGTRAMAQL